MARLYKDAKCHKPGCRAESPVVKEGPGTVACGGRWGFVPCFTLRGRPSLKEAVRRIGRLQDPGGTR